ncbi:MAG: cobyrinic acid a,c-diamide synthase [Herpetosiphonaceae bacterium]|nr:MAG: cobyrinic acid a,c-diamide synthase [Herpetosiphonaceae bacterium]
MPSRVIAVTNFKGGIGKTTTTVNVGSGFALKGARVLLVDVDPQGSLAISLGISQPRRTLYDVLVDGRSVEQCLISARPGLDLLAADDTLLVAQQELARRHDWARAIELALRPVVRSYDFVFLDCSASLTVLNASALSCASDIIVPTALEHLALQGLEQLCRNITRIKGTIGSIRMIIPTMVDTRQRQANELLESLKQRFGSLVTEPVRVNVRLSEAPAYGKTIYEYDPRSRGAIEYAALVERLSDLFGWTPPAVPPVQQPASPPATQQEAPAAASLDQNCPHCGGPVERMTLAGYKVVFCVKCKWKTSQLITPLSRMP